jgi:ribonuclease P protein component
MDGGAKTGRFSLRRHRLQRGDFERAFRLGARAKGESLTVVVQRNGRLHARLGLSVGKRVSKRAVDRNRWRRLLREAFRHERRSIPAGLDVVLIALPGGPRPQLTDLRRELVALVRRAFARLPPEGALGAAASPTPRP